MPDVLIQAVGNRDLDLVFNVPRCSFLRALRETAQWKSVKQKRGPWLICTFSLNLLYSESGRFHKMHFFFIS